MGQLEEITALARHLGKVQRRCSALIEQQQREIEKLKQHIQLLEGALRSRQTVAIEPPHNLSGCLAVTQNKSTHST